MAIDPSIPLQVKPLTFDFAQSTADALKLKHLLAQDKLNTAFVFDTGADGNPVLNRPKTLANMYRADPQTAMAYEQKLALQDHWAGQRAYQQQMLQGAEQGRKIKAFNALTSRMRADLGGLYSDFELDPRSIDDPTKLQDFTQRQENLLQNYRKQGLPLEDLRSQGALPQTFDPNAVRSAINDPNSFQKVAQAWYQSNPNVAMTDTGEEVNVPDSPEYNPGDLQGADQSQEGQAPQQDGSFVPTGAPRLNLGKLTAGPKVSASQQKMITAAQLLAKANAVGQDGKFLLDKESRDQLVSSAVWLERYGKHWNPNEALMYDADKKKLVINPLILQVKKEVAAAGKPVTNVNIRDEKSFAAAQKLRDDFRQDSKLFRDVKDSYSRVAGSLDRALKGGEINAAETLAAATSFMKMLDPGSVVRESELAMALAATGWLDRIQNVYNTIKNGKVLTPDQVRNFAALAKQLYDKAEEQQIQLEGQYAEDAKAWNLDPQRVIPDFKIKPKAAPTAPGAPGAKVPQEQSIKSKPAPAVGAVVNGYKFKGGDPNNKANWVKVQ